MYFAANDVVKVVVTAILVGQAVAVPVPNQGAVLDARDLDMLMARDPRFSRGFKFGAKLFDMFGGGNNGDSSNQKRDLDEAADEEAAGMLEARDPRGFLSGFKNGLRIWDSIRGGSGSDSSNQKRDLIDEAPEYEEAAEEESGLVARDPRGFLSGFKHGLRIWDSIRGGSGSDSSNQKRDLDEAADEEAAGMLEARDPRGFLSGFKQGLRIWDSIRGGSGSDSSNQKRDLIDEAPEYEEAAEESSELEARDLTDEAPEYEEAAEESSELEARDFETLEAREPGWFKSGIRLGKKIVNAFRRHRNSGGDVGGGSSDDQQQQQQSS